MSWTQKDKDYLVENYNKMSNTEIGLALGKKPDTVQVQASRMGISKSQKTLEMIRLNSQNRLPKEELEFIKCNYGVLKTKEIAEYLDRPIGNVESLARHYGLKKKLNYCTNKKTNSKWSEDEVKFLKSNYMLLEYKDIAIKLNKTVKAIQKKIYYLQLPLKEQKNSNWSKKDLSYLQSHYKSTPMLILKDKLKRTSSAIRAKAFEMGLLRDVSTYIEKEVRCILHENFIEFQEQVKIRGFVADFVLKDFKVIEVHGDYWHSNPEVYENPKTDAQIINFKRDIIKDKVLKKEGYQILYIWEKDLNENYDKCVNDILNYAVLS